MHCPEHESIGDYVDGSLDGRTRAVVERHLALCGACRTMVEDLRAIRAAARALEPHALPPRLWARVSAAVGADGEAAAAPDHARTDPARGDAAWSTVAARGLGGRWLATAAAVLAVAAATSWIVWRQLPAAGTPTASVDAEARPAPSVDAELKLAEDEYVQAIAGLEALAAGAAGDLDPDTAAIVRTNLTVIDRAIDESRAALGAEPWMAFVQESLFDALHSKVALLEDTVALVNEMRIGEPADADGLAPDIHQPATGSALDIP